MISGFHIPELIRKKRDGQAHNQAELKALILGYTRGHVSDYQISAWLMAVYLKGMTPAETADLTMIMATSGDTLDLHALPRTVDKHSTGGVGNKTTLIVAPILAALGCTVAKMSGRGLAHTGGTIDKLESFPGWTPELSEERFIQQAREIKLALVSQTKDLAPADGKLYALRDVTATVDCLPLIASSVMSKKLASGAHTIILDVKVGAGAFMQTLDEGRALARAMVDIGTRAGRCVRAVITDMNAPLGRMAGNSLEIKEALMTLRGQGPHDLTQLCISLAAEALVAYGEPENEAKARIQTCLQDQSALQRFRAFIHAQGGNTALVDRPQLLDIAPGQKDIYAPAAGFIGGIDAHAVGCAVLALGGGREQKGDRIDHGVGVELLKKPGECVQSNDTVMRIYHRDGRGLDTASALLTAGLSITHTPPPAASLVLDRVHASSHQGT